MSRAILKRLASMDRAELRFRAASTVRLMKGRVSAALTEPRWNRRRFESVLAGAGGSADWLEARAAGKRGDYAAAHRALARYLSKTRTAFPLNAGELHAVAGAIRGDFPDAEADARRRADRLLRGRYDILGYRGLHVGQPPDWHADPVHGRRSPRSFWASIPYLDPAAGDHKVIWEINRHQHWLTLGRAYALSGDERYYREFTAQLASWLEANPPLTGTNWASMLEVALRSISWLWASRFFAHAAAADPPDARPWLVDLMLALDRQLAHVEENLSHYFSPNTHLLGEALGLYVAGRALPGMRGSRRWTSIGREVLLREIDRQIRPDGGHAELSAHYHRYSTDFYLLALTVARRSGDDAAGAFESAARRQATYLRALATDAGRRPRIGDDDGGQLFPMCGRPADDCRDTLATAAVLLSDPALAVEGAPEETYWMCGAAARAALPDAPRAAWTSAALPASGYYVSRSSRGDYLVFDAGPHGFLNGGHAHADALSIVLDVAGRPLLIDPGTATYTMDRELRDRFRSTAMHNTLVLDGRPQSLPRGPFHWARAAAGFAPIWRSTAACDYVEGTHDGYLPRRHARTILVVHGIGWWVIDHLLGSGTVSAETFWHLDVDWTLAGQRGGTVELTAGECTLALALSTQAEFVAPGTDPLAVSSPAYGRVEPAPLVRTRTEATLPATLAAFIPARSDCASGLVLEQVAVTEPPPEGWHAAAFHVRWAGGAMRVQTAIERAGYASGENASPGRRWGTAEVVSDARTAALIEHLDGRSEVVLINGSWLRARGIPAPLVHLPQPAAVLRCPAAAGLVPTVHEVAAE